MPNDLVETQQTQQPMQTEPTTEPTQTTNPTQEPASPTQPEPPAFDIAEASLDALKAKLPEGTELNEALASEFLTLLNGAKSRTELAEGLMDMQLKVAAQAEEAMTKAWNDTQAAWKKEMEEDPKVGGTQLSANLAKAQEVINTYAENPAAVKELLTLTGSGNSVHMLKFLMAVSSAIPGESAPVEGNPTTEVKPREQRLFTTS
ncbi:MAG: hypothetical protein E6Q97_25135 [Desulfurellales bacterium]|nr:MAG: hypothetical protein E6Q97_25135 [Desulfurellales bacterium]